MAGTGASRGDNMTVICCQCKALLGETPPLEDTGVSHGYCKPCAEALIEELHRRYPGKHVSDVAQQQVLVAQEDEEP